MNTILHATDPANVSDNEGMGHIRQGNQIDVSHDAILYVEGLNVFFDQFQAIRELNFYVKQNELRCVIGPNGAGKTTLMDVITGKTGRRNANIQGSVYLGQTIDLLSMSESDIAQIGVGRKFQKPTVFEAFTVWENLALAQKGERGWWPTLMRPNVDGVAEALEKNLTLTGLTAEAYRQAGNLSHGQKQRLEIGMLLMQQPTLLLLDEPAAGMSDEETHHLAALLNQLRGRCSMMVVEHDMSFVEALAGDTGTVTVLAEGSVLAEGTLSNVKANPQVIESYLGR